MACNSYWCTVLSTLDLFAAPAVRSNLSSTVDGMATGMALKCTSRQQHVLKTAVSVPRCGLASKACLAKNAHRCNQHRTQRNCARSAKADADDAPLVTLDSLVPAIGFAAMIGYVALFSPNQTPLRDQYFIEKLIGQGVTDGVPLNPILVSLFFLMGNYPVILACLGIPSLRSANKVPLWPFVSASFAAGVFALFPYLIFWQPTSKTGVPDEEDMTTGVGKFFFRASESRLLPLVTLISTMALLYNAFYAGIPAWNAFFKLFDESRFVHVTSLDFCALTALTPFFLYTDAEKREWGARDVGVPVLSLIPLVGPLLYLIIRPKASAPSKSADE